MRIWYLSRQQIKLERPSLVHCTAKALSAAVLIVLSAVEGFLAIQRFGAPDLPKVVRLSYLLPLSTSVSEQLHEATARLV